MHVVPVNVGLRVNEKVEITAPIGVVWELLTNVDRWPQWQPQISQAELVSGKMVPGSVFHWTADGARITSTVHMVDKESHLSWTGMAFGARAFHEWNLIWRGDHLTTVTTEEAVCGTLAKVFRSMYRKKVEQGLHVWLEALKAESERLASQRRAAM